ncbi:MAG: glycosyltransferase family 9 protein, partial [Acidobacteria bacterium]|nr:glycosyltransferase family 9 protein [Acidobacteriota bacterium]
MKRIAKSAFSLTLGLGLSASQLKCCYMKIVVRGTNWIGDAVMTIPAMRELRGIFPNAHISLHTRSWATGIFQDADFIDEILSFEAGSNSLQTMREQARIWRDARFDLAILFTNSFQTALLSKLGRVKRRFGYRNEGRSFLLTDPVEKPEWKNEKHEVFYYLNLIGEIESDYFGSRKTAGAVPNVRVNVSDKRRLEAREILTNAGIDTSKKTLAFGVGSTNSRAKRWPAESYAALCDLIMSELGANVILIGSTDEIDVSNDVMQRSQHKPLVLTGKTTLAEVTAILSEVDL